MTLVYILRDVLKYADNAKEAISIASKGLVLVDKKVRREACEPVGLMDVVEFPKMGKFFRLLPGPKGLVLKEISEAESKIKPCRIVGKKSIAEGKTQISLNDGSVMLLTKDTFKTKDTLVLELPSRKIKDILEFKKGNTGLVYNGRHSGGSGEITEIHSGTASRKSSTKLGEVETLTDYVIVIGKGKPAISI